MNKLIYISALLIVLAIAFSFFLDVKLVLIFLFSALLLVAYFSYKEKVGQELVIAFLFALVITSYFNYVYLAQNFSVGKINLFPLVAWTFGLVVLREVYERVKFRRKFIPVVLIYWAVLFVVEYVGYYLLKIRLNSNFPSIFGIGIMHTAPEMKVIYLAAGPIYLLITDYLKVK